MTTPLTLPAQLADIDPARLVLLLDIDGTLAPIVEDPLAAAVPHATLDVVRRAVDTCASVGVVTGRGVDRAREMVPVDGVWIAAAHGMHLVAPDGTEDICPVGIGARHHLDMAAQLAQTVGWHFENKPYSVTINLRQRGTSGLQLDEHHVRSQLAMVLHPTAVEIHSARQALEIRPAKARTKRDGVLTIMEAARTAAPGDATDLVAVMFGDDRTDLDAFAALDALAQGDGLDGLGALRTVKVGVASDEVDPELTANADLMLDAQADVVAVVQALIG